ncbi:purine-nucleoside phosphorylase [Infirmifilum lucidum]|uniref:Purine-nucleoside phosphorylase n=1 Tax=Infirmifilum lucidum TaxID=2776706 RepID=A0A7L9FFH4_9CREN|nr:purine-nucleoside phosphorylase [Infirmifilum lucidum]QOJ78479.1 purine-nucleoside phosphorylase [Infirmifilum lucidum]
MGYYHPLSKRPYHILARPGDVAEKVVVSGDPQRVEKASRLLDNPRIVNKHRGFLTITGEYNGVRVTLATHGIGAPSAAIVFEELFMLGAREIIRAGTCGALRREAAAGTIVIIEASAYTPGGTLGSYFPGVSFPAYATPELVLSLERAAKRLGVKYLRGVALSHDAFHVVEKRAPEWGSLGIDVLEMESATLFALGRYRGFKTGALALVVDNMASGEELTEQREELELRMVQIALEALTSGTQ